MVIIYFYSTFHLEVLWVFTCSFALPPPSLPLFHCMYVNTVIYTYILFKPSSSFMDYIFSVLQKGGILGAA